MAACTPPTPPTGPSSPSFRTPPKNTPPPTKATAPPQQPKLKLNIPKTTNNKSNSSAEQTYVAPKTGTEEGVPSGAGTGPPAPTAGPATSAPATPPPPPTPTPKPVCAVPNADASLARGVDPEYPDIARQQGASGVTQVKVTLTATGAVSNVTVYKSSGNAALDQSALTAARASTFNPEIENCAKIPGSYIFRAEFNPQ